MKYYVSFTILILILTTLIYSNTFIVPFQFDDLGHIVDNYKVHSLNLKQLFEYSKSRFLLHLSFALNYHFGKGGVFGFHLTNLLLHILNSILVFLIVLQTFNTPRLKDSIYKKMVPYLALFSSLIFATHPIQTESVTYIYQRGESLMAFFYLLALFLYIQTRSSKASLAKFSHLGCLTSVLFCSFTKPTAVTLLIAILLYEVFFLSPTLKALKNNIKYILPILILIVVPFLLARFDTLESKGVGIKLDPAHLPYYYTKSRVLVTALRLLILPVNQNLEHDFPLSISLLNPAATLFSFIFLVIFLAIGIFTLRRLPIISFSIIWFYLTLSVTSLLYLDDLFFEHYLYLNVFSYAFVLPVVTFKFFNKIGINTRYWKLVMALLVLSFCIATYKRNEVWKSPISLWEDTVKKSPNKARPNYILGVYYFRNGKFDSALNCYKTALKLNPEYAEAYYRLGEFYLTSKDLDRAISNFKKAIDLKPDFYEAHLNLSALYYNSGNFKSALEEGLLALNIRPDEPQAYLTIGSCYIKLNQYEEAKEYLNRGLVVSRDQRITQEFNSLLNILKKGR